MNADWHERHPMPKHPTLEQRVSWHIDHQRHCACRPIPVRLAALMRSRSGGKQGVGFVRALLSGGDRRSIARSNQALTLLRMHPARMSEVVALTEDADWLVSMRSLDLLDKLAHEHPEWIERHKHVLIGPLADSDKWEIRLQIVRALALFDWTPTERRRVLEILLRDVEHPQKFVRAWALDSLAIFAEQDASLLPVVRRKLREFERSGSKALAARARRIRERLL